MFKLLKWSGSPVALMCALSLSGCDEDSAPGVDGGGPDAASDDAGLPDASADGDAGDASEPEPDAGTRLLGVNDVSYLFPLPAENEQDQLLALSAAGEHGVLLTRTLYDTHVERLWEGPSIEMGYDWCRVTAMRLDPCGGQTTIDDPASCVPEVRLSVQPTGGGGSMIDAAIHLIYQLPRAELDAMLEELLALKSSSELDVQPLPLGPHPIMVEQGLGGAFATGVQQTILAHVGVERLVKLTFMDRGRNSDNWRLHLVERSGDAFAPAIIPATGTEDTQQGVDEVGGEGGRFTSVHPVDDSVGYPSDLLDSTLATGLAAAQKRAALDRLATFEDPTRFSSLNLDCGSCHVNTNARGFYEQLFTLSAAPSFVPPPGQNVERHDDSELRGNVLLSFGYFTDRLVVSQRVINESARVADWLSHGLR
jgi:hypothetical protein